MPSGILAQATHRRHSASTQWNGSTKFANRLAVSLGYTFIIPINFAVKSNNNSHASAMWRWIDALEEPHSIQRIKELPHAQMLFKPSPATDFYWQ